MDEKRYKCVVLDDEPLALELIKGYVLKTPLAQCEGAYCQPFQAYKRLEAGDIDILFTDINMAGINGIDLARMVPKSTCVIFVTAFPNYALDGFKVNAVDYLMKPVQYSDFLKAFNKAVTYLRGAEVKPEERHYISIRCNYQAIKLDTSDIIYIEAVKDYMKVVTKDKHYLTLVTMKQLLNDLPEAEFVKVHRSYVVNKKYINVLGVDGIVIEDRNIPVSVQGRAAVNDIIAGK